MAALLSSMCISTVFASSNDITINSFIVSPFNYTPLSYQAKEDISPLYLYITNMTNNRVNYVNVRALATGNINLTLNGDCKYVDHVVCARDCQYSVRSNIRDNSYTLGTLAFNSLNYINNQTISGVWSVDSVNHYTYAYEH